MIVRKIRSRMPWVSAALRASPARRPRSSARMAWKASDQRTPRTMTAIHTTKVARLMRRLSADPPELAPVLTNDAWFRPRGNVIAATAISSTAAGSTMAPAWAATAANDSPTDTRRPLAAARVALVTAAAPTIATTIPTPPNSADSAA